MKSFFCVNCESIGIEQPCFLWCHDAVAPVHCIMGFDPNWTEYKSGDDFEVKHMAEIERVKAFGWGVE
jgi:hypothetical protein